MVVWDYNKTDTMIPNFVGGPLPWKDQGDREYYCCTMLTLFKPWRSGKFLKKDQQSWNEAFQDYDFSEYQIELMQNFNLKYECNNAHDDYYSAM